MNRLLYLLLCCCMLCTGCVFNIDKPVDKTKLWENDFRLFQGTRAWPLARAAYYKNYDEVDSILKKNPEFANIADSVFGSTLVTIAIYRQDYRLFKILLDYGANIRYHDKKFDATPLITACGVSNCDIRFARDLIQKGASVNDTSTLRGTPVMVAAQYTNPSFVKLLIQNGADVDYRTEGGENVLWYALAVDRYDTALCLLENGADFNVPTSRRTEDGKLIETSILQLLRMNIPDPGSADFKNKQKIIKFLKEKGLDYYSEPVPPNIKENIQELFPNTWQEYIRTY